MKNVLILLIGNFLMVSNINGQNDTTKLKKKILVGFNVTSLKIKFKKPGILTYYSINDSYVFAAENEVYARVYLHKNFFLKPVLSYSRSNYYLKKNKSINNGPDILFEGNLTMKETVDKLKLYAPIGFGLPNRRFSFFAEAGLGFIPFLKVKNDLKEYDAYIKTNYWSQEVADFIPNSTRFSKDYGRIFLKCAGGLSIKFFKSFTLNSTFSIEKSNYRRSLNSNPIKWKYLYWGISLGLMYTIR